MEKIKIVDSIMGSGKSQMAIQMMNEDVESDFIYITPYLDEIRRIKQNCTNRKFTEPKEDRKNRIYSKTKSLKELLKSGSNIATTHSLFKLVDKGTEEILQATNYTLILDEVMDVVQQIPISKADQTVLFENSNILQVDENNRVILGGGAEKYISEGNGKFAELIHMSKLGRLFKFQNIIILWEFPIEVFKYFKNVYILTYLFDGQIQKYFFDFYDVKYDKFTIIKNSDKYELVDHSSELDKERIKFISSKINIYEGKLNSIGARDNSFSYSWYKRLDSDIKEIITNNIYNYLKNINKAKSRDCLWTSFKEFNLNVPSFKRAFIVHNTRATNEYSDTHTLAYCVNRYISPFLVNYFKGKDISINQDVYALSEMLQWIFRSRIRNDEEVNIYIPNTRMRNLLKKYLTI